MRLMVIEAPGKASTIERALSRVGANDIVVFATRGHLFVNPARLTPVGVDRQWRETLRSPRDPARVLKLQAEASRASEILIATDPDSEGHAIAADINVVVTHASGAPCFRVLLHGLDDTSVADAIKAKTPFDPQQSVQAVARRIFDRVLASTLSDKQRGIGVGRVITAALGAFAQNPIQRGVATITAPAADGGPSFAATLPVFAGSEPAIKEMLYRPIGALHAGKTIEETPAPWHFGDACVNVARVMRCGIDRAAGALQSAYERGRMSYPRTDARAYTDMGAKALAKFARGAGVSIDSDALPRSPRLTHEALRPLERADAELLTFDLEGLPFEDKVVAFVARAAVASGIRRQVQLADPASVPDWARARGLVFSRTATRRLDVTEPPHGIEFWSGDVAVMGAIVDMGLGRPSTWVDTATKLIRHELVDHQGALLRRGKQWLAHAPRAIGSPAFVHAVERALVGDDVVEILNRCLETLPPDVQVALDRVLTTPPTDNAERPVAVDMLNNDARQRRAAP